MAIAWITFKGGLYKAMGDTGPFPNGYWSQWQGPASRLQWQATAKLPVAGGQGVLREDYLPLLLLGFPSTAVESLQMNGIWPSPTEPLTTLIMQVRWIQPMMTTFQYR